MRFRRESLFILVSFLFLAGFAYAADVNYPYGTFRLKLPPSEDPFPGMGSYFTTLSKGMKSALWNPASLGKLKLSEASLSLTSAQDTYNYQRNTSVSEISDSLTLSEGGSAAGEYGIFFRPEADIGSGINTQNVAILSQLNYATTSTGYNFSSAMKVNDWISVGFSSNNPIEFDSNLAGDFPITARAVTSLYGQSISSMQIANDGKISYTYESTTYESTQALWNGFLSQEVTLPLASLSEFRNSMNIQSAYTSTIASKIGNLCLGVNMIPISATANINNVLQTAIPSGTEDIYLYTPDFDTSDETDIATWVSDPDEYGTSSGYKRKTLRLPAGEIVGEARYRGYYAASTARFDIGAMYDVNRFITIGFSLENATGSSLNFRGSGIASYLNYRNYDTAEVSSLDNLLLPGGQSSFDLITDTWVSTDEVSGTKLFLEPQKNYALPKRIRYGIAIRTPFLIAIDFEQNQTPIKYTSTQNDVATEVNISDINFVRIGLETRIMRFPSWLRMGLTLISKPTITGLDSASQASLDSLFTYGYLPLKFDLGSDSDFWGTIIGGSFGVNAQSIISILQFDSTNIDLSKMVYYNTYLRRGAWEISYLALVDPGSTLSAYSTKTVPTGETRQFEVSDLKFIQTLGVTYRF